MATVMDEGALITVSGVHKDVKANSSKPWKATIRGKYLACFETEVEAARAYDRAVREQGKPLAWLNFPDENDEASAASDGSSGSSDSESSAGPADTAERGGQSEAKTGGGGSGSGGGGGSWGGKPSASSSARHKSSRFRGKLVIRAGQHAKPHSRAKGG